MKVLTGIDPHCIACGGGVIMASTALKAEGVLRMLSVLFVAMGALLVGFNSQTKTVFFVQKKATVKVIHALWIFTIISSITVGYQFLQLCRCLAMAFFSKDPCYTLDKPAAWLFLLLDQGVTYATFAATMAATQGSLVAVTGMKHFEWSKLCNIYTRFCEQIAGGMTCALVGCLAMAVVSSISAQHAFRRRRSDADRPSAR